MIVFVHGNPETAAIWDPLIAALGRDDVVALSPPGFGAPTPDGWGATSDEYLAWLIGEVEQLDGPIDLVGHDWGGGHVQRLAATAARPDPVLGHRHRRLRRPRVRLARHGPGLADAGRRRGGGRGDGRCRPRSRIGRRTSASA